MMLVCRVFTLGLVLSFAAPALAITEQATQSATEFYQAYRKAFAKAQKIEDILPMMAASQRAKMEKTPADERTDDVRNAEGDDRRTGRRQGPERNRDQDRR